MRADEADEQLLFVLNTGIPVSPNSIITHKDYINIHTHMHVACTYIRNEIII